MWCTHVYRPILCHSLGKPHQYMHTQIPIAHNSAPMLDEDLSDSMRKTGEEQGKTNACPVYLFGVGLKPYLTNTLV